MKKDFHVRFKYVEVYHFSRCLGIDKVPERGNNPLGMECNHFKFETIDISKKNFHVFGDNDRMLKFNKVCTSTPKLSKTNNVEQRDEDSESIHSVMSIDYTPKSLQPMNPIQRKKCLEGAGVIIDKLDDMDKNPKLLTKLRETRKQVGCKCSNNGKCDSSKCICSSEGIPCQSDGNKFPCKCGDKCSNKSGKRIYSFTKIKYHYNHTLNRKLILNEDLDFNILSTTTGDCPICGTMTDETWNNNSNSNNCPEPFHQTRSRKRAGDDNAENIKNFKQMITIEENDSLPNNGSKASLSESNSLSKFPLLSGLHSSNNRDNEINNDHTKITGMSSDAFSYYLLSNIESVDFCKIPSPVVLDDSFNKENIKFTQGKFSPGTEIKHEPYLSPCPISNKLSITPLRVEIPNGTLVSPCSSITYHQDSRLPIDISNPTTCFNSLPIISTPFSNYHQSFLNKESFNESDLISPPSQTEPSPFRFNPVALAPSVDNSFMDRIDFITRTDRERNSKELNQVIMGNYIDSLSPESILSDKTSTSNEDNLLDNLLHHNLHHHHFHSKDRSNENSAMTTKMKQLHLTKSDSDPILLNLDSANNLPMKSAYSIRPIRNYQTVFELQTKNICKRKTNIKSKPIMKTDCKRSNLSSFRTGISVPNVTEVQGEMEKFETNYRNSLEITFFDIPLLDDENEEEESNEFKIDSSLLKTENIK